MKVRRQRCGQCDVLQNLVNLPVTCTKHHRFCDFVEVRLAELISASKGANVDIKDVDEAKKIVTANFSAISESLEQGQEYPETEEAFLKLVCDLNQRLFDGTGIEGLGRLRNRDERVVIDVAPKHTFEGSPGDRIEKELRNLWEKSKAQHSHVDPKELHTVARHLAYFLVGFFAIHPFNDGNGRTARFILRIMAKKFGCSLAPFADHTKERNRYVDALRNAHRNREDSVEPKGFGLVTQFVIRYLRKADLPVVEIEPPATQDQPYQESTENSIR